MDKKDLERRLEAAEKQMIGLQDEIQNLKAKLDEVQDEEIPVFPVFKNYETAFFIDRDEMYERFHTEEYAKLYADKCREIAMLLHCKWYVDRDISVDWSECPKFCVCFDHNTGLYVIDTRYHYESSIVIFSTEESAQKAADWLNKHWKENTDE